MIEGQVRSGVAINSDSLVYISWNDISGISLGYQSVFLLSHSMADKMVQILSYRYLSTDTDSDYVGEEVRRVVAVAVC